MFDNIYCKFGLTRGHMTKFWLEIELFFFYFILKIGKWLLYRISLAEVPDTLISCLIPGFDVQCIVIKATWSTHWWSLVQKSLLYQGDTEFDWQTQGDSKSSARLCPQELNKFLLREMHQEQVIVNKHSYRQTYVVYVQWCWEHQRLDYTN